METIYILFYQKPNECPEIIWAFKTRKEADDYMNHPLTRSAMRIDTAAKLLLKPVEFFIQ